MKLDRRQRAFKADEITYLDRKRILLDRMLLSFFELLRYDGQAAVRRRRRLIDIPALRQLMDETPRRFEGFSANPQVAEAWLANDLLEISNRGKVGREAVVGPRPFHLNAFKLAQPKYMKDYGASAQVWAMLYYADRPLLGRLKAFFGQGIDPATDEYDFHTELDLETLAVLGLVDQVKVDHATSPAPVPIEPLCTGQGRILAEDLRFLLAYEGAVPRHVLATYVRTAMSLHLSLLLLRLFRILPAEVKRVQKQEHTFRCPVDAGEKLDCTDCPFGFEIKVDLVEEATGPMAALAEASAAEHIDGIASYVRSVILLNRLKDFGAAEAMRGRMKAPNTVADLLAILADPPARLDAAFENDVDNALRVDDGEEVDPIERAVISMPGLSPLDQFVELICLKRLKDERNRLITLVDSLTDKNRPGGFLRQSAGARAQRRFVLGSRLLETLVQIAVVDRSADGRISSRPVLIDDFMGWLQRRYGFVIYAPMHRSVPPNEQEAWRSNERALRERLHQIGFYTDLSDAYNSQTLRPRYPVNSDA